MRANPNKLGLVVGVLFGGMHLLWSLVVLAGWGQALYDFILWAHMVHLSFVIGPFDMTAAVTLVVITAAIGYVVGNIIALVWNWAHRA